MGPGIYTRPAVIRGNTVCMYVYTQSQLCAQQAVEMEKYIFIMPESFKAGVMVN